MANWHGYLGVENLALNATQKATLVAALRALGPATHPSPACLCHWRTRLDGEAAIFEALFNEDDLTVTRFKNGLAAIFGVAADSIDHAISNASFASGSTPVVTFSRTGTDYLRVALFGGVGADWNESRDECRGYLAANMAEWENGVT